MFKTTWLHNLIPPLTVCNVAAAHFKVMAMLSGGIWCVLKLKANQIDVLHG